MYDSAEVILLNFFLDLKGKKLKQKKNFHVTVILQSFGMNFFIWK